jgi:hypothetical protein
LNKINFLWSLFLKNKFWRLFLIVMRIKFFFVIYRDGRVSSRKEIVIVKIFLKGKGIQKKFFLESELKTFLYAFSETVGNNKKANFNSLILILFVYFHDFPRRSEVIMIWFSVKKKTTIFW